MDPSSAPIAAALSGVEAEGVAPVDGVPGVWAFESDVGMDVVVGGFDDDDVAWVEPLVRVVALAPTPDDEFFGLQWHMSRLGAPDVWRVATGAGVVVAVVDTGVAPGLDGFTNLVAGYDAVEGRAGFYDGNGHGTHVAGTVGQSTGNGYGTVGLAPNATILPVRVLSDSGSGTSADVAEGIRWAADNGAQIINLSLGSSSRSSVIAEACDYARDQGVLVVAASGNDGFTNFIGYPAALASTLAVGATALGDQVTGYSNKGQQLSLVAPGGDTTVDADGDGFGDGVLQESTFNGEEGFYFLEGTSMATPHVSAVAALLVEAGVDSVDELEQILLQSATDLGDPGWDPVFGHGLVDPVAALALVGGTVPTVPDCEADRCAVDLEAGDIRLTEVHPDPGVCSDVTGEWLEVVNRTDGTVDLNGIELRDAADNLGVLTLSGIVQPGQHVVLGRVEAQAFCGPAIDGTFGNVALNNGGDALQLSFDGVLLDAMSYPSSEDDESWSLPEEAYDSPVDSDWERSAPTPGSAHGSAPVIVLGVEELVAGDLLLTEVMANPAVCFDSVCEWLELENTSGSSVDLDGLVIGDASLSNRGEVVGSVVVADGERVVLGRGTAATWGYTSFTPAAFYGSEPALNNGGDQPWLGNATGHVADMAAYGDAASGVSIELTGADPEDAASWALSTTKMSGGDFGTPGS